MYLNSNEPGCNVNFHSDHQFRLQCRITPGIVASHESTADKDINSLSPVTGSRANGTSGGYWRSTGRGRTSDSSLPEQPETKLGRGAQEQRLHPVLSIVLTEYTTSRLFSRFTAFPVKYDS